jgi:hypothetical protein
MVDMTMPKKITLYFILGKLMNRDLDQVVNKTAFEPDVMINPYKVLNALQEFQNHKKNKLINTPCSTALILTYSSGSLIPSQKSKFLSKVIHSCVNGEHNPEAASHQEPWCFENYLHLQTSGTSSRKKGNTSASFVHALVFITFTSPSDSCMIVIDSAASHHMVWDRSLFVTFEEEKVNIKTGSPHSQLNAIGHGTARILIIELQDFLLVPNISQQLISMMRLIFGTVSITKTGNSFTMNNDSGNLLSGKVFDNLLHSQFSPAPAAYMSLAKEQVLWHNQLGHQNTQVMKSMNLPVFSSDLMCEAKSDASPSSSIKIKEVVLDQGGGSLSIIIWSRSLPIKVFPRFFLLPTLPNTMGLWKGQIKRSSIRPIACC